MFSTDGETANQVAAAPWHEIVDEVPTDKSSPASGKSGHIPWRKKASPAEALRGESQDAKQ
jgi:hypothetical protein